MALELAPGTYDFQSSENFDEYMKAVGVGMAKRLIGNQAKPKQVITVENGTWTITSSTIASSHVLRFEIGKEFDETTADGRKVKTTFTISGNKLIASQKGPVDSTLTREFSKDGFVMTLVAKDVTCVRHYSKRQ